MDFGFVGNDFINIHIMKASIIQRRTGSIRKLNKTTYFRSTFDYYICHVGHNNILMFTEWLQ